MALLILLIVLEKSSCNSDQQQQKKNNNKTMMMMIMMMIKLMSYPLGLAFFGSKRVKCIISACVGIVLFKINIIVYVNHKLTLKLDYVQRMVLANIEFFFFRLLETEEQLKLTQEKLWPRSQALLELC